jgi:hypothetical protein
LPCKKNLLERMLHNRPLASHKLMRPTNSITRNGRNKIPDVRPVVESRWFYVVCDAYFLLGRREQSPLWLRSLDLFPWCCVSFFERKDSATVGTYITIGDSWSCKFMISQVIRRSILRTEEKETRRRRGLISRRIAAYRGTDQRTRLIKWLIEPSIHHVSLSKPNDQIYSAGYDC